MKTIYYAHLGLKDKLTPRKAEEALERSLRESPHIIGSSPEWVAGSARLLWHEFYKEMLDMAVPHYGSREKARQHLDFDQLKRQFGTFEVYDLSFEFKKVGYVGTDKEFREK